MRRLQVHTRIISLKMGGGNDLAVKFIIQAATGARISARFLHCAISR